MGKNLVNSFFERMILIGKLVYPAKQVLRSFSELIASIRKAQFVTLRSIYKFRIRHLYILRFWYSFRLTRTFEV